MAIQSSIANYLMSSMILCFISAMFITVACNKEKNIPPLTYCCTRSPINKYVENAHIYLPNAFTPNNDNINDILFVQGDSIIEVVDFSISNESIIFYQGQFPANDPSYGWDGTVNGVVEKGVYSVFVQVRIKGGFVPIYGWVCNLTCEDQMEEESFMNFDKCRFGDQFNGTAFDSTLVSGEMFDCF